MSISAFAVCEDRAMKHPRKGVNKYQEESQNQIFIIHRSFFSYFRIHILSFLLSIANKPVQINFLYSSLFQLPHTKKSPKSM